MRFADMPASLLYSIVEFACRALLPGGPLLCCSNHHYCMLKWLAGPRTRIRVCVHGSHPPVPPTTLLQDQGEALFEEYQRLGRRHEVLWYHGMEDIIDRFVDERRRPPGLSRKEVVRFSNRILGRPSGVFRWDGRCLRMPAHADLESWMHFQVVSVYPPRSLGVEFLPEGVRRCDRPSCLPHPPVTQTPSSPGRRAGPGPSAISAAAWMGG